MNIAIFCAANGALAESFFDRTRELGTWLGRHEHTVVFGGCDVGLMGCVAHAVNDAGGRTIGVVPQVFANNPKRPLPKLDELILCQNLSDRKDLIIKLSDEIVALPGGVGTLDEVFHLVAQASVGYHKRRVILYNIDHFWDDLQTMLQHMEQKGVLREGWKSQLVFVDTLEQLIDTLQLK